MYLLFTLLINKIIYYFNNSNKIWFYWEGPVPFYIKECRRSLLKNNDNCIFLNNSNIYDYLPELKEYSDFLNQIGIAQKVDIFRIFILQKYGGLYLDSDIFVIKNLKWILDKLYNHDYVGFGATGPDNTNGYGFPSNWAMASRPNGILVTSVKNTMKKWIKNKSHNKNDYHAFGKHLLWEHIWNLSKKGYTYFHVSSHFDGTRDYKGRWINSDIMMSNKKIYYACPSDISFVVLYNSELSKFNINSINDIKGTNLFKLFSGILF